MPSLPADIISILPDDDEEAASQAATFIEVYIRTRDPMLAWVQAGMSDPRFTAAIAAQNYLRKPEIAAAISALEKLQEAVAANEPRVEITRESIMADVQVVFEKALSSGNFSPALGAKKLQAIIMGLVKTEVNVNHRLTAGELPDHELERIASQYMRDSSITSGDDDSPQGIGSLPAPDRD